MKQVIYLLVVCFYTSCVSYSDVILNQNCYDFIHGKWIVYEKQNSFEVESDKVKYNVFQFNENHLQIEEQNLEYYFKDDCSKLIILFKEKDISFCFYKKSKDTITLIRRFLNNESYLSLKRVKRN